MKKFLFALPLLALSLWSCSSDDPVPAPDTDQEAYGDSYISVSISVPTGAGSRAGEEPSYPKGDYNDGLENESKVDNIVFFFFDSNDNCVDIQKLDKPTFTQVNTTSSPYVTSYGVKEVRLKAGLHYAQVAVVLNSNESVSSLRLSVKDLKSLKERSKDYAAQIDTEENFGVNQLMSNSVYFDEADLTVKPSENNRVVLVKIDENLHKYTSSEKSQLGTSKHYVEIYVERAAARVDVKMAENWTNGFKFENEKGEETTTLKLYNNTNNTEEDVYVFPEINGMMLDVLTPAAKLIKPLNLDEMVGYSSAKDYTAFQWNDPKNKRSYWATTADFTNSMRYFSWDEMANGSTQFTQYINPNTQDFIPEDSNEELSKNTKVVVAATLKYYKKGQDKDNDSKPLNLVRYGGEHMFAENLLAHTASLSNAAVRSIDWSTLTDNNENDPITFTEAERTILGVAVHNAFLGIGKDEPGIKGDMYELVLNETTDPDDRVVPYEAKIVESKNFALKVEFDASLFDDYNDDNVKALVAQYSANKVAWDNFVKGKAVPFIKKAIDEVLVDVNVPRILYWKGGKTYYYYVIRHQGFYGLVGGTNDEGKNQYLYGIVRNHIYDVTLSGLFGLGTPVIESDKPIDPERPTEERPHYISAKINILPWRVVTQQAVVH